ncbi:hypothetical protein GCM10027515_08970 [Schumannella luteola]|uniref:Uncharacterized protein n=1 Tax=Schumannella luteola TaxID=472059 RepID=A0A852Y4X4_9MICO|nr:hypothetical protein [Schumannella luteola]NYG97976.1 hypothetical protein [Schumannella luteola]TPX01713.1 hypothetical protein FJ656_25275 [Schumannella luteola]
MSSPDHPGPEGDEGDAGRTPAPLDPGAWVDPDTREWRMDRDFPDRSRGALASLARTRPELVRPTAALLLGALVIAVGAAALGAPTIAWSAVGLGVLVALGIGASQTSVHRDFDAYAGSIHQLRFTPTSFVLSKPGSTLEVDWAGITGARARGDLLELRTSVDHVIPLIPLPLLGPTGLRRLREAIDTGVDAAAGPPPPFPITHPVEGLPSAYPVGSTLPGGAGPGRAAVRMARGFATSPAPIVLIAVVAILLGLQAVTGSRLLGEWAMPYLIFLGLALAVSVGAAAIAAQRARRRGLVGSAQLQSDRLATRIGPTAATYELAYVSDVQITAEHVLFQTRPRGQWHLMSRELLTAEAQRDLLLRVSGRGV